MTLQLHQEAGTMSLATIEGRTAKSSHKDPQNLRVGVGTVSTFLKCFPCVLLRRTHEHEDPTF